MVRLVGLVVDEEWTVTEAAGHLRRSVDDEAMLRRVRGRVRRVVAERGSVFGERALATLDAALLLGPPAAGVPAGVDGTPVGRTAPGPLP